MSAISIKLKTDALDDLAQKGAELGKSRQVALVGARGAANLVRNHLFALDESAANQMGGPRTHFYSDAAKSVTEPEPTANGAMFTITKVGLAQRWLGGTIKAGAGTSSATGGPTKYLAIPARAEAYGKTPGEFEDLVFIPRGPGRAMLVEALQSKIIEGKKRKSGARDYSTEAAGGLVMFWLVSEVTQQGDPNVMPTQADLEEAARYPMQNYISRLLSGPGGVN